MQLTHLIFADNLMIFTRGDLPSIRRATQVLLEFSKWLRLRPNFDKTEAYFGGISVDLKHLILTDTGPTEGTFSFRYLGLPANHARLSCCMYDGLITKLQTLSTSCAFRSLSYTGKLQVINSMVFGLCMGSIRVTWIINYFLSSHTIWDLSIQQYFDESLRGVIEARDLLLSQVEDVPSIVACLLSCVVKGSFLVILILAIQRKLAILDMLVGRGISLANRCILCKCKEECARHLFFKCPLAAALSSAILSWACVSVQDS
ncbi:uncharacterized protein LOC141601560 [Silene latifolia]|uniref:uncharacterized protein LOC141601560 n=1 Tax=Silene latifolia TaxID=37657 RepID=UPI003D77025F